ncbi:MAG TPA: hypothetical protein VK539_07300 [Myxococcaceae bacterium]|nr:hypothetical protein [Myxococcaceae bacterium]
MDSKSPDTASGAATETPWELAQRLAAQGLPLSTVNEQLLRAGLPAEDAETLTRALQLRSVAGPGEKREADSGHGLNMLVGIAKVGLSARALLANGDLEGQRALDGMLQVTAGFMQVGLDQKPVAPTVAPPAVVPEVAPFEAEDGAPRCQVHSRVLSVSTCPRCAAHACYSCAPKNGPGGTEFCVTCEAQPSVHEPRVRMAARRVAVALFAEAVLLLALMLFAPLLGASQGSEWGPVPVEAALGLFFVVLGSMQWFVPHPAPGVVGAVVAGGLLPASIAATPEQVPTETLVLLLVPMAVMLFTLDRLATRRKALLALRKR